ncbi:MAG: hypothetical protein AB8B51_20130 [Sedimentitalea sp.]
MDNSGTTSTSFGGFFDAVLIPQAGADPLSAMRQAVPSSDGRGAQGGVGATTEMVFGNSDAFIDGVLLSDKWSGVITYSFPQSNSVYNYSNVGVPGQHPEDLERQMENYQTMQGFMPITQQMQTAVRFAMNNIRDANNNPVDAVAGDGFAIAGFTNANILFEPTGAFENVNIKFARTTSSTVPVAEVSDFLGNYNTEQIEDNGDVWFGSNPVFLTPEAGNYAWATTLHEIGHAMGLKHAHEDGRTPIPTAFDTMEYTVMTYRSYVGAESDFYKNADGSFAQTYMMADIAALQYMYGANYAINSGNTAYKWNPNSGDTLVNGEVGIDVGGNKIFATLWDGGGIDSFDLTSYSTTVVIDLRPGGHSVFSSAQLADLGDGNSARGNIFNAKLFQGNEASLIENAFAGSGNDVIHGNQTGNGLYGGDGDDSVYGYAGDDRLFGQRDDDTLRGGDGDDLLSGGGGNDTRYGQTGDDELYAYFGSDSLYGGTGADRLHGDQGNNALFGGSGNDTYVHYASATNTFIEFANEGIDTLEIAASTSGIAGFDLANYANIENLTFTGTRVYTGYGDANDNRIQANDGGNALLGRGGDDTLRGGTGDDVLDGGTGGDIMFGQDGDDKIFVDSLDDSIYELAGGGEDTIYASISWDMVQRDDDLEEVENLILTGSDDLNGRGNALDNVMTGNDGFNVLRGLEGDDTLRGMVGDDALLGGAGNDTMIAGGGANTMDGGTGNDYMVGGDGDDSYFVDATDDTVIEEVNGGYDTIYSSITWDLALSGDATERVEALYLTGTATLDGYGNVKDNSLNGNDASNELEGRAGNDTLNGNGGDDFLYGGAGNDRLNGGDGNDVLSGSQGSNIMNGQGGKDSLYGAEGNDIMNGGGNIDLVQGGAGNDTIKGAAGNDTLLGEAGNDNIKGGNGDDIVQGGTGNDVVRGGNGDDNIKGNGGNDILNGEAGDDTLNGSGGSDEIDGGAGADSIKGGGGADVLDGGTGDDFLNGGGKNDVMNGGSDDDRMLGGGGNDVMSGGQGADELDGGAGDDALNGDSGKDELTGGSGADSFEFSLGGGRDTITDFEDDTDTLVLEEALWGGGKTIAEVLSDHASVVGTTVVFDFGSNTKIVLLNITDTAILADDLVLI